MNKIYRTGLGAVKVRAVYSYDPDARCIEVTQIPPSTTIEAIIDKVVDLVKEGKLKEISDVRDETDLSGLRLAFDLKKGQDPDAVMNKLFRLTPLQDNFNCNFNVLINGTPRVMGVYEILNEWTAFRRNCVKRRVAFDLKKKKEKLHLLNGLKKILLDIDYAIKLIRETDEESEVVPNLMIGFGIDEVQAEYVAEIKLRHINREYILKRTQETADLEKEIADMEDILGNENRVNKLIIDELREISKKYGQPRRTMFLLRRGGICGYRGGAGEAGSCEHLPDPGGVLQEDNAAVPEDEQSAQAQGKRRDNLVRRGQRRRGAAVLHRQAPGLQDPLHRFRRDQGERNGRLYPREARI